MSCIFYKKCLTYIVPYGMIYVTSKKKEGIYMTTVKDVYSTWLTRQASDETVKSYEITAKEFAELMFNKKVE